MKILADRVKSQNFLLSMIQLEVDTEDDNIDLFLEKLTADFRRINSVIDIDNGQCQYELLKDAAKLME